MQDLTYRLPQERTLTSAPADGENAHLNARREESLWCRNSVTPTSSWGS